MIANMPQKRVSQIGHFLLLLVHPKSHQPQSVHSYYMANVTDPEHTAKKLTKAAKIAVWIG